MELTTKKPISFNGTVLDSGKSFKTHEQHGRQLIQKGYAVQKEIPSSPQTSPSKSRRK